MKRILMIIVTGIFGLLLVLGTTGCGNDETFDTSKLVTRYSRDRTSGTRDGFFTAIEYSEAKEDDTKIPGFIKADDNANMISLVKNDIYGIGYISLASLSESGLKALRFEGVIPSEATVVDGTYKLSRNFNYVTVTESDCTEEEWLLVKAFLLFTTSKEGLGIIKSKDGILTTSIATASSWEELLNKTENLAIKEMCERECSDEEKIEIKVGGSTSVEKIATALTAAFEEKCPSFKATHNHTGSGDAYKGTQGSEKDSVRSMHIGFLSRELKADEEASENTSGMLCKDGIVVVVNNSNTCLESITKEQLKNIYSTQTTKWSDLIE